MIKPIPLTHICANYTYNHVLYDVCAQTDCMNVQTFAQINRTFLRNFLAYYRKSSYICSRKKIPTSERRLSLI
jgi:hypothetical protein